MFFGRNDAKAETPVLRPPHAKCCLIKIFDDGDIWIRRRGNDTEPNCPNKRIKDYIKYLKTVPAQIMYSAICTINSAAA